MTRSPAHRAAGPRPATAFQAAIFLCIAAAGCGYVGEPLPPALNIPERVADLRAVQRGSTIVLEFTVPDMTTENLPMPAIGGVELRAGPMTGAEFDLTAWAASAKRYPLEIAAPGPARADLPAEWSGQEVVFAVRLQHPRGRMSEWSNLVVLQVVEPVPPPQDLRAESIAEGVRLSWQALAPDLAFRIYRREPADPQPLLLGTSASPSFLDTAVQFGKTYEYSVLAVRKAGAAEAESRILATLSIAREDHFAPAVPAGLTAVSGDGRVELAWSPAIEPDLVGYHVYRAEGTGSFERIAELVETPSYSDREVKPGQLYRYAISALDRIGNESARSEPIEVKAQ